MVILSHFATRRMGTKKTPIEQRLANAKLIVTAVNACTKLNPDNPVVAAESISDLYEALKAIIDAENEEFESLGYGRSQDARKALAKAEKK